MNRYDELLKAKVGTFVLVSKSLKAFGSKIERDEKLGLVCPAQKDDLGLFVMTSKKCFFYRKGFLGEDYLPIAYDKISNIERSAGLIKTKFTINFSGGSLEFEVNGKEEANAILDVYNKFLESASKVEETTNVADKSEDLISKLENLGKLRDNGVLTEDEFKAAKAKLLGL